MVPILIVQWFKSMANGTMNANVNLAMCHIQQNNLKIFSPHLALMGLVVTESHAKSLNVTMKENHKTKVITQMKIVDIKSLCHPMIQMILKMVPSHGKLPNRW